MRSIWSEIYKRKLWRQIWIALAETQVEFGLVTPEQVADLQSHSEDIDIERALEIETEIHHDVMAEIHTFAEQCQVGGGIIHLGMTSMDVVDNADALRARQSLDVLVARLREELLFFCALIKEYADIPIIAFTHLQPAEPSTLGYRLAQYAQDLLTDWHNLTRLQTEYKGKGLKGSVGTSASYSDLIGSENLARFEVTMSKKLGLPFFSVATQIYPRKQDYDLLSTLAGLGASLHKFALDLRLLQSPPIGELSEPFESRQVGSSAMPFKRNPINAEKINSLARILAQFPRVGWDNAAGSILERTLDDSANRRSTLPEAFLIADELLITALKITKKLRVNEVAIQRNLAIYGPFASTERVLLAACKAGADRQEMHEHIRTLAMNSWQTIQSGGTNPLIELIVNDAKLQLHLSANELRALMVANHHVGDAPDRARLLCEEIQNTIN